LLFFYDTTLRIGASAEVGHFPDKVFLQQGAYYGAEATGISLTSWTYEKPYQNPQVFYALSGRFRDLQPMDIETLLCIKETDIANFMNFSRPREEQHEGI
jgi:hypothetical protein